MCWWLLKTLIDSYYFGGIGKDSMYPVGWSGYVENAKVGTGSALAFDILCIFR